MQNLIIITTEEIVIVIVKCYTAGGYGVQRRLRRAKLGKI